MATDAQLIQRTLAGDTGAFGILVERYYAAVWAVCRRLVRDEHRAQDAAQDTFVRAYLKLRQLRNVSQPGPWLRRVAHSVCVNRLKQQAAEEHVPALRAGEDVEIADARPTPEQYAEARELAEAVMRSIRDLPPQYRKPVEMFYLRRLSHKEIAVQLGVAPGNVRTRLHRARKLLESDLAGHRSVEALSRSKHGRFWLPSKLMQMEDCTMALQYDQTERRLPRGESDITIRAMRREDLPAVRAYDIEMTARLDERNAQVAPGKESCPGGPWSEDEWLAEHFEKYAERGNITLLAEDGDGKVVGFADLWVADEPEPFGRSLNVECIDFFHEYYTLGLEVVLLQEAEKVALAAGLPALDIGTNTASGDYPVLRRFGLKVFYEYDDVLCRCGAVQGTRPERRMVSVDELDLSGLIKVDHWSPTDFTHEADVERTWIAELAWPECRAVLELLGPEVDNYAQPVPPSKPVKSILYVEPQALTSADAMGDILAECAALAGELGADQLRLPCPSEIELGEGKADVIEREFAFAWMRKRLDRLRGGPESRE